MFLFSACVERIRCVQLAGRKREEQHVFRQDCEEEEKSTCSSGSASSYDAYENNLCSDSGENEQDVRLVDEGSCSINFATFKGGLATRNDSSPTTSGSDIGPLMMDEGEDTAVRTLSSEASTILVVPKELFQKQDVSQSCREGDIDNDETTEDEKEHNVANASTPSNIRIDPAEDDEVLLVLDNLGISEPALRRKHHGADHEHAHVGNTSIDDGELADAENTSLSTVNLSFDTSMELEPRPKNLGRGEMVLFEAIARIFAPTSVASAMRREASMLLRRVPSAPPPTPMASDESCE